MASLEKRVQRLNIRSTIYSQSGMCKMRFHLRVAWKKEENEMFIVFFTQMTRNREKTRNIVRLGALAVPKIHRIRTTNNKYFEFHYTFKKYFAFY